jgi:hypothetical protein
MITTLKNIERGKWILSTNIHGEVIEESDRKTATTKAEAQRALDEILKHGHPACTNIKVLLHARTKRIEAEEKAREAKRMKAYEKALDRVRALQTIVPEERTLRLRKDAYTSKATMDYARIFCDAQDITRKIVTKPWLDDPRDDNPRSVWASNGYYAIRADFPFPPNLEDVNAKHAETIRNVVSDPVSSPARVPTEALYDIFSAMAKAYVAGTDVNRSGGKVQAAPTICAEDGRLRLQLADVVFDLGEHTPVNGTMGVNPIFARVVVDKATRRFDGGMVEVSFHGDFNTSVRIDLPDETTFWVMPMRV